MEIQSEKIVETWFCYNSFSWFQQLGAIPAPEGVTPEPEPKMVIAGGLSEPSVDEVGTAIGTFAQRLNTHDLAGLPALVTEDFVAHDIMPGDLDVVGYQTYLEAMQTGLEDWSLSGEALFFIEGDLVFSLGAVTGMFNQVLNGIEPNGNTVSFPIFTIFRVEDGKIAEIWGWHDSFGFISQLTAPPAE